VEIVAASVWPSFPFGIRESFSRSWNVVRIGILAAVLGVGLGACSPKEPEAPAPAPEAAAPAPAAAAPDPTVLPTPAPDARMGTINLMCGGSSMRVAFEDTRAVVVNDDGSNTELQKLEPQPGAPAGVVTYTNGKMTFAREGEGDTAKIRYATGKAAFQDCAKTQDQDQPKPN
jgi:hypothetical protein